MYAKSATTIANILKAAESLFIEKNYADVTMSGIASVADVTKGALYYHFKNKEALYLAMMRLYLEKIADLMQQAVHKEGTCEERLYDLTLSFFKLPEHQQNLMRLVRRDVNIFRNPEREELVRAYQAALPEQVEHIIGDGIREGELKTGDSRILAWEHVAMVEVVLSPYARGVLGTPEKMCDYVIDLFLAGARKKKENLPP